MQLIAAAQEAKAWHWVPPCWKNCIHQHSLTVVECLGRPNSRRLCSEVVGTVFQQQHQQCERHAMYWEVMCNCHTTECLNQLIYTNHQIMARELHTELNIGFRVLEMIVPTLKYCKVWVRWFPKIHRSSKNIVCKFVRMYWSNTRLKVTVSWMGTFHHYDGKMRYGATSTSECQNSSP